MKKYLLPSALILCFGLSLAIAQNITRSVQLAQSAQGPIGFDTSNGVYFPGHVLTLGRPPVLTSCGTSPTIAGTDYAGTVTGGSANAAGCVITFAQAYLATPYCLLVAENPATSPLAYSASTTAITISGTNMGAAVAHYICSGSK